MYRLELIFFAILSGLLLSELFERISRIVVDILLKNVEMDDGLLIFIVFLLTVIIFGISACLYCLRPGLSLIGYLRKELSVFRKSVEIEWPEDWEACTTKSVLFTFSQAVDKEEDVTAKVYIEGEAANSTEIWTDDMKMMELIFPSQRSGTYKFHLFISGTPVRGSPWEHKIVPGIILSSLLSV